MFVWTRRVQNEVGGSGRVGGVAQLKALVVVPYALPLGYWDVILPPNPEGPSTQIQRY